MARTRTQSRARALLADPKAAARIQEAAASVGITSEQLVDLVVDSGLMALPPADGITEVMTLEDLGTALHAQLSGVPSREDRPKWFGGLTPTQKVALITTLRAKGYSTLAISNDFGVDQLEVNRLYHEHADKLGAQVMGVRQSTLIGTLQIQAEKAQEAAMEKGDVGTFWRVAKEMISILQSMGIVDQAAHKMEVTHKFDEVKKAEIQKMLDMERRQQQRLQEIKHIEATVHEPIPEEVNESYD